MISLTLCTAFLTPFPRYLFLSPSRSSNASCSPVDAPEGTIARPRIPVSSTQSTSTVGFPRESKTSLALIFWIRISIHQYHASRDRKSTRLNSSHSQISYAVFCLEKKKNAYDTDA